MLLTISSSGQYDVSPLNLRISDRATGKPHTVSWSAYMARYAANLARRSEIRRGTLAWPSSSNLSWFFSVTLMLALIPASEGGRLGV